MHQVVPPLARFYQRSLALGTVKRILLLAQQRLTLRLLHEQELAYEAGLGFSLVTYQSLHVERRSLEEQISELSLATDLLRDDAKALRQVNSVFLL